MPSFAGDCRPAIERGPLAVPAETKNGPDARNGQKRAGTVTDAGTSAEPEKNNAPEIQFGALLRSPIKMNGAIRRARSEHTARARGYLQISVVPQI
jgi:hypothetical protein